MVPCGMPLVQELREIKTVLRNLFAREELGEARQDDAPLPAPRASALSSLFAREPLEEDAPLPPAPERRGALAAIFAPEPLPEDPPRPAPKRAGVLAALFAPEALEEEPVPAPPRRSSGWLRWLFGSESLDSPQEER